jgi:hypothetical protein
MGFLQTQRLILSPSPQTSPTLRRRSGQARGEGAINWATRQAAQQFEAIKTNFVIPVKTGIQIGCADISAAKRQALSLLSARMTQEIRG